MHGIESAYNIATVEENVGTERLKVLPEGCAIAKVGNAAAILSWKFGDSSREVSTRRGQTT